MKADRIADRFETLFPENTGIEFSGTYPSSFNIAPPRNSSDIDQVLVNMKSNGLWAWDPAASSGKFRLIESEHTQGVSYVTHNETTYKFRRNDRKLFRLLSLNDNTPIWREVARLNFLSPEWDTRHTKFFITDEGGIWLVTSRHLTQNGQVEGSAAAYYAPRN